MIYRHITQLPEIDGSINPNHRGQCTACSVPIDRCSNFISIILSWEHWERGIPVRDLRGGCVTFDEAEELAIFCSEECLHEGLKRGIA
jgi:hypothetical protein